MAIFTKESLETLRQRIDLIEVLSPYVELKPAGGSYKGLCPFHDEKTPSFMMQKGDSHYHCFGCGAHGDAIHFMMHHLRMSFGESVEALAERFHVILERVEGSSEKRGPNRAVMKEALNIASRFFHFYLLHTPDGKDVLEYLYKRGIDLEFIRLFQIGLAPQKWGMLRKVLHRSKVSDEILEEVGLIARTRQGAWRDFFSDRITFPVHDPMGNVIGFSARKYKEETFGGKYVNTSETPLFKKSKILYGMNYCRRRIAKGRKAIIVEGQIDALRLIKEGLSMTVAGQGTAFGEGHLRELLNLGVETVYLALDADEAGKEAALKIGHLFQKAGVEVYVAELPFGSDPDSILLERGAEVFVQILHDSGDYLQFLVKHLERQYDIKSPAGKSAWIANIVGRIREWDDPLMVHESLRKLAHLANVPENMIGVTLQDSPNLLIKKSLHAGFTDVDPDRVVEFDFLRWLLLLGREKESFVTIARENITVDALKVDVCKKVFNAFMDAYEQKETFDLLSLAIDLDEKEQVFIAEIHEKKVNLDKAEKHFYDSIQKLLDRNWMLKREEIKIRIHNAQLTDDEAIALAKEFDDLKSTPPKIVLES